MWHFIVCFGDAEAYFIPVSAFFQVSDINNHVVVTSVTSTRQRLCVLSICLCVVLGVMIWSTNWKKWLTFGGAPVPGTASASLFHFPFSSPLRNGGF